MENKGLDRDCSHNFQDLFEETINEMLEEDMSLTNNMEASLMEVQVIKDKSRKVRISTSFFEGMLTDSEDSLFLAYFTKDQGAKDNKKTVISSKGAKLKEGKKEHIDSLW